MDFMEQLGWPCARMEALGIMSPVMVLTGGSEHVFLSVQERFVRLKRELPEFHVLLIQLIEAASGSAMA